jgi:hypothetical protein
MATRVEYAINATELFEGWQTPLEEVDLAASAERFAAAMMAELASYGTPGEYEFDCYTTGGKQEISVDTDDDDERERLERLIDNTCIDLFNRSDGWLVLTEIGRERYPEKAS